MKGRVSLVVGLCVLLLATGCGSPSASDSPSRELAGAWAATQQFVKRAIKSPSTASFGSPFRDDYQKSSDVMTRLGEGRYRAVGWVDSENGFGAMIRTNFTCVVRDNANGTWSCEEIKFAE